MAVKKQTTSRSSTTKGKAPLKKAAAKKPAKKAAVKKTAVKATEKKGSKVTKKTTKKPVKKTAVKSTKTATASQKTKSKQKTPTAKPEVEAVVLPRNMSIRSREKALVLSYEWNKAMHRIAYVSGMCFAVVGSTLALLSVFGTAQFTGQPALVAEANSVVATTVAAPQPQFLLESTIPEQVTENLTVNFTVNDVSIIKAKLFKVGETRSYPDLEINNLLNNKHRLTIKHASYPAGWYDLVVTYIPTNTQFGTVAKKVGTFHIGVIPEGGELVVPPSVDPTVEAPVTDPSTVADAFRVFTTTSVLTGTVKVGLAAPSQYSYVELYARPFNSLNSQFIALATERFGQRQFAFDSASRLANGTYELYAESKNSAGQTVTTKSIIVTVSNAASTGGTQTVPAGTPTTPDTPESTSPVKLPPGFEDREFIEVEFERQETTDSATEKETVDILNRNSTEIRSLIQGYAVAKQSGDQMLIEAAKNTLQEKRQSLVFEAMNDERVKDLADNIDARLAEKIADLEKRVDAFEAVRTQKSGGSSATDTDGDGVTDFDETNIFKTDPENADSDSDGFTDGAEIVRGFNPLNAESEAIIQFESPRNSMALVRDDVLSVDTVVPLTTSPEDPVYAQIFGTGLPNSFVTLYIFSNPIVVTVKTDDDGSFVYTLDKELEDGTHDVFVALTDNTGAILGQSNPFSFIKRAQAFTPVDASESEIVSNENIVEVTNQSAYSTVAGVGILALGIILVMLGVSLRSKKDEDEELGIEDDGLQSGRISGDATAVEPVIVNGKKVEHIDAT